MPKGWEEKQIAEVIAKLEAGASVNGEERPKLEGEIAVLKISAVTSGHFDSQAYKVVTAPSEKARLSVIPAQGSILISRANTLDLVGASAYISKDYPDLFLPDKLWRITSAEHHSAEWLSQVLATKIVRTHISSRATGTSGSMKNISQEAFLSIRIPTPPLAEQRKIAAILGTWDAAIDKAERLVAALRARKQSLMQRLLTGEVRFVGFEGKWETKRFGEVFERVTRKNNIRNTNVLTASGQHGLVSQTDYFNRSVAGVDIENYYLIGRGEFAYNRSSSEGYPFGAIKQLIHYDAGILSTLYLCFRLADESGDADFYRHFFEAGGLNRGIYSIAQEGARNHGLLNVSVTDFLSLDIPVPSLLEQRKLAVFFDMIDREINIAVQQRDQLSQQKRGLMQRLLTGEVRVAGGEER